jgi:hypothetical protein
VPEEGPTGTLLSKQLATAICCYSMQLVPCDILAEVGH